MTAHRYTPERALACHAGFVAAADNTTVVGDERWTDQIRAVMALRKIANTAWVRAIIGQYTVYVAGNDEHSIAIVFSRDTSAVKWLLRTARAMLRDTDVELP